jgi:hypothetical protein
MRVVAGRERRNRCESDERDREREREQGERVRLIGWEWMRMTVLLGCFRLFVRCVLCLCVLCCVLCACGSYIDDWKASLPQQRRRGAAGAICPNRERSTRWNEEKEWEKVRERERA